MASSSAALVTLLVASCAAMAAATSDYTVGDGNGWAVGVDYSAWTSGKSFVVGDKLVFTRFRGQHTVTQVNQSDYASCSSVRYSIVGDGSAITVTLTTPGTHYYICVFHCDAGMKLAVTVAGGGVTTSGASLRVPAMGAVVAAAAGALVKVALF